MSSSEKDYLLRTPPPPAKKVILKGVAIGALVIGILLAVALSIAALVNKQYYTINQQDYALGMGFVSGSSSPFYQKFIETQSSPISAKVHIALLLHISLLPFDILCNYRCS